MQINKAFRLKQLTPDEFKAKQEKKLRQAAEMYEEHFLNKMVQAMRSTVNRQGGFIQQSFAEKIFDRKLDQQYVKSWANQGGIGLADMIYKQLHEKLFPDASQMTRPKGPLPVDRPEPTFQIKMKHDQVIFHGNGEKTEAVTSPWSGKIEAMARGVDGWNHIRIHHPNGVVSQLAFQGHMLGLDKENVDEGQKLGLLSMEAPFLRWDLSRSEAGKA